MIDSTTAIAVATIPILDVAPPADRHPALVYLAGLGAGSRRTMRQALDTIAELLTDGHADAVTLPWWRLGYQHTAAIRARLADTYGPATANKMISALRGVLRECWRLGLVDADTYRRAADLAPVASSTLPRGRALPAGELRALFAACAGDGPAGARDAALFSMLYGAALRRSEAVALDLGNLDTTTGAVTILAGKGRKDRIAYLPSGGIAALADWLAVRGDRPGPLLCPVRKDGVLQPRRMSDQAVLKNVAKRARGDGVARSPALLLAWARREADRQFAEGPVIDAEDLPF